MKLIETSRLSPSKTSDIDRSHVNAAHHDFALRDQSVRGRQMSGVVIMSLRDIFGAAQYQNRDHGENDTDRDKQSHFEFYFESLFHISMLPWFFMQSTDERFHQWVFGFLNVLDRVVHVYFSIVKNCDPISNFESAGNIMCHKNAGDFARLF